MPTAEEVKPAAPHVPASFINAIAEEGSKREAIEWLQKTWNENCQLRRELSSARAKVERLRENTQTAWLVESVAGRWGTGFYLVGFRKYNRFGTIDKAIRFCRREDAEAAATSMRRLYPELANDLVACEHIWSDALTATRKEQNMTLEEAKRILNNPVEFWDLEQQALVKEAQRVVDAATRKEEGNA